MYAVQQGAAAIVELLVLKGWHQSDITDMWALQHSVRKDVTC
jgi:hypothetical protein